MKPMDYCP